jgi:hypothetical protein
MDAMASGCSRPRRSARELRRRWGPRVVTAAAAVAVVAALASPAGAGAPCPDDRGVLAVKLQPCNLKVTGGEDSWHADRWFYISWDNPGQDGGSPLVATHFRVRNPAGTVISPGETRTRWVEDHADVEVSPTPGVYTFEAWNENATGDQGAISTAKLRYDPVRPGDVAPLPVAGWVSRNEFPLTLRIGHPGAPFPASGIHGYAVSIDDEPAGDPCAAGDRCADAETDLRGGIDDDSLYISGLPEGANHVHAVAVSGAGMKSTATGHTVIYVDLADPVTTLDGVPSGWANQAVTVTARATDSTSGMGGGASTAIRVDGGAPKTAPGGEVSATAIGDGIHTVAYYARDAAGNSNDGGSANGIANEQPATATVRIDRGPPQVSFANFQSPLDPESIEVRVADPLSGPDLSRGRVEVRRAGTTDQFERLPVETANGKLVAHWDSDAYPAGEYEFRATGHDAAGNAIATARRGNGSAMTLTNPLKLRTALWAGFGGREVERRRCAKRGKRWRCRSESTGDFGRRPRERLVPYGRGALYSGRLSAGLGTALAGVAVRVTERFDPGASEHDRTTTARTGADGVFTVWLAPGPSRQVEAVFAGNRTASRSSAGTARLLVSAGVRLRASSAVARIGGRPVIFNGRIGAAGAAIPPDGKAIQLQFRVPGIVPWTEFRTIQTDAQGRFRFPYAFSDDDSRGVGFQFRAFAPAQSGWPFEPASSNPVTVTGR